MFCIPTSQFPHGTTHLFMSELRRDRIGTRNVRLPSFPPNKPRTEITVLETKEMRDGGLSLGNTMRAEGAVVNVERRDFLQNQNKRKEQ
jgi:hypothetical protein